MATLSIRQLPEDVHAKLRLRAARAGRSMEAEARAILAAAVDEQVAPPTSEELAAYVDELYGADKPSGVVDDFLNRRRTEWGDV